MKIDRAGTLVAHFDKFVIAFLGLTYHVYITIVLYLLTLYSQK